MTGPDLTPPPLGPVGASAPVHLYLSRWRTHTVDGEVERTAVSDSFRPTPGWTSCLLPGHYPARTPRQHRSEHGFHLDCACDVACPRCGAGPERSCRTLDGGGMSGGGYPTSLHAARIKVSPRCQGLLDGSISRCDLGDHDWQPVGRGPEHTKARCARCSRTEPLQPRGLGFAPGRHWSRRPAGL